ncbi:DUF1513 domain-containing protein [Thioclava sp. FR2]|uniref:DUF1513 domain-containing protein n=1 Tax=Thioclava sp. FR2 TaxID=3445780 RepID=UPI003EBFAE22
MTSRRAFLAGFGATALMAGPTWADVGNPVFVAAGKTQAGYVLHGLDAGAKTVFSLPLPDRGHAAAVHPLRPQAVAFARRPGIFGLVFDCLTGDVLSTLTPPAGRQFNGHGAFSPDGQLLLTSEVVAEGSAGKIGLWDTRDYRRLGEWNSGGIGPHDIKLDPAGGLIIANGGIETDPSDRTKLNVEDMKPNLTRLSPDGQILDQAELPRELNKNSIRHLALIGETIAFAMQWEGDIAEPVPLLGLWVPGTKPRLCPAADHEMLTMKGYAGSIAAHANRIAVTSSKGGAVMLFDISGEPITTFRRADLAGVAPNRTGFVASDGNGALWQVTDDGLTLIRKDVPMWDNHLVAIG